MKIRVHDIGVCSWSLGRATIDDLIATTAALGLRHVQLALAPLVAATPAAVSAVGLALHAAGVRLTAGMMAFDGEDYATIDRIRQTGGLAPDGTWPARRDAMLAALRVADQIDVRAISTHVGFVPAGTTAGYAAMVERVRHVAAAYAADGVVLLLETGQETAGHLATFLQDVARPNVRVNFDPANMLLYGAGDPVEAVGILARHIGHVHVKDAIPSDRPGEAWGREVPVGQGAVDWTAFLHALAAAGYAGPLVIERERAAGTDRTADIAAAVATLTRA